MAPYFRTTLTSKLKEILSQPRYSKPDKTTYSIWEDGLKVYTTIDRKIQEHAEDVAFSHMAIIQKKYDKAWSDKDPWTYTEEKNTEKAEKQINQRKDVLLSHRRASGRYIKMRDRYMSEIFSKVLSKYPKVRLDNIDISRMLREDKESGYFKKVVREGWATKDQIKEYRKVMTDPLWKELKTQRNKLIKKANKVFSTPVKMKVFDYTNTGDREVTMTPMDSIKYHQEHMQIGSVSIDPRTGYVKSWVGGVNKKYYKVDHVQTNRQVGSTFKTLLYATVIAQQGISPCFEVKDIRHGIPANEPNFCLLYTSPSPRDATLSRMPSSA